MYSVAGRHRGRCYGRYWLAQSSENLAWTYIPEVEGDLWPDGMDARAGPMPPAARTGGVFLCKSLRLLG